MFARWTFLMVLAGVMGTGLSSARAGDSEDLVKQYLDNLGAQAYTITAVNADYIANSFPDTDFFEVRFRQYPTADAPPEGLSASNLFLVQDGEAFALVRPADLKDFFFEDLAPAADEDDAADAGLAWLRLSEAFSQDGFYTFTAPEVIVIITDVGFVVTGSVNVADPISGTGGISIEMIFDSDGVLDSVDETRTVRPGMRPRCQATLLLHSERLVREIAEQDLLVMGRRAAEYLYEQRAKARPELQEAIDRVWQRIVDEGR